MPKNSIALRSLRVVSLRRSESRAATGLIAKMASAPATAPRRVRSESSPLATAPPKSTSRGHAEELFDLAREAVQDLVVGVLSLAGPQHDAATKTARNP